MSGAQLVLAHAVKIALLVLLLGLFTSGRYKLCWAFLAYLGAILAGNCLVTFWPDTFYTGWFWTLKQGVYDLTKLAVALELAFRTFRSFPGARPVARAALFGVLGLMAAGILLISPGSSYQSFWEWQPNTVTGTIWLFAATALLAVWYRIPLDPWPRALMLGFAVYLLSFVTVMNLLSRRGWVVREYAGLGDSAAYLLLVSWWAFEAWRRPGRTKAEDGAPILGLEQLS